MCFQKLRMVKKIKNLSKHDLVVVTGLAVVVSAPNSWLA